MMKPTLHVLHVLSVLPARPVLLVLLIGIAGCAPQHHELVSYNPETGHSRFSSEKLLAGNIDMTGGLASGHRVMMQAFATCDGNACVPDQVEIAFFNDSSADLNLDYRRIEIVFGPRRLEWEDPGQRTESAYFGVPRGEFIRIPISRSDFAAMASAPRVEILFGTTGGTTLRVPHGSREPLRELAEAISQRGS